MELNNIEFYIEQHGTAAIMWGRYYGALYC